MAFANFVLQLGMTKFIIFCLFTTLSIGLIAYVILKITKELSLKIGSVAISLKGEGQKKDIVNLVFDYGTFQDEINDTKDLAITTLHKQAKRYTKLQLVQYLQKLRGEYAKVLEPSLSESKQITNVVFNMFTNELKDSMFAYLMDIYEKNHLSHKSEEELKELAHNHYEKLADMFKDHAASIWIPVMQPYSQVRDISIDIASFVEGLVFDILNFYKGQSKIREQVFNTVRKICDGVKDNVNDELKLPDNAKYLAENFYTESNGLNFELVSEFLNDSN